VRDHCQKGLDGGDTAPRPKNAALTSRRGAEKDFGDFPLSALADCRTRGIFMEWRNKLAAKSLGQADYAWTVLARILSVALKRGKIDINPCDHETRGGQMKWMPSPPLATSSSPTLSWFQDHLLYVPRQNIATYVPMPLDVSSVGLIDPARHRICHELAKPPQS
jgi:hypothetical protein